MLNSNDQGTPKKKKQVRFFGTLEICIIVIIIGVEVVFLPLAIYNVGPEFFKEIESLNQRNYILEETIKNLKSEIDDKEDLLRNVQIKVDLLRKIIEENMDEQEIDKIEREIQHQQFDLQEKVNQWIYNLYNY